MVTIKQLTETDYVEGVINQDRSVLARAITLIESTHCLLYTSDAADE